MPNPVGDVYELSAEHIAEGLRDSRDSPRRRILFPMHRSQDACVQRMVNFLQPGTYVQPHLHPREWASETVLVLSGKIGVVIFDNSGAVVGRHLMGKGRLIDIEAGVWHGLVVLDEDSMILEIKRGPFDKTDIVFAPWSPPESSEERHGYLSGLAALFS